MEKLMQKLEAELNAREVEQAAAMSEQVQAQYMAGGPITPLRMLAFDRT